jgi:Tfp pilus assembly protein PilZ
VWAHPCYVWRVSFGLQAPAAVPVELRAARRRVFRLSHEVGEEGVRLTTPAPFEVGEPVELRLRLPEASEALTLRAEVVLVGDEREENGARGGCGLRFLEPTHEVRAAIASYVRERLGLPGR